MKIQSHRVNKRWELSPAVAVTYMPPEPGTHTSATQLSNLSAAQPATRSVIYAGLSHDVSFRSFMASSAKVQSLPHLEEGEVSLLELAADDPRDVAPLSDREAMILQLYHRVQEQKLEKALLEQGVFIISLSSFFSVMLIYVCRIESENVSGENVEEQLAIAEQELLEARATFTVRRKAVGTVLMTEPSLKAVHLKATSPAERYDDYPIPSMSIYTRAQPHAVGLLADIGSGIFSVLSIAATCCHSHMKTFMLHIARRCDNCRTWRSKTVRFTRKIGN